MLSISNVLLRDIQNEVLLTLCTSKFTYVLFLSSFTDNGYALLLISLNILNAGLNALDDMSLDIMLTGVNAIEYLSVHAMYPFDASYGNTTSGSFLA